MKNPASLYLFLGTPSADRWPIIIDLIQGNNENQAKTQVLVCHDSELSLLTEKYSELLNAITVFHWKTEGGKIQTNLPHYGSDTDIIYWIFNPWDNYIDELEIFCGWVKQMSFDTIRSLGILNFRFIHAHPTLHEWHEGMIHFCDCVILTDAHPQQYTDAEKYIKTFRKKHFPCQFEIFRSIDALNPHKALQDQPRRLSMIFDKDAEYEDIDENNLPEEPFRLQGYQDPYFVYDDKGKRIKVLPDVRPLLKKNFDR